MKTHNNIYEVITNKIVESLGKGVLPWYQPWKSGSGLLPLRHNGIPYQGMNILILWLESLEKKYTSTTWMTFKQAQELGGSVKKGSRGTHICYANTVSKEVTNDQGEEEVLTSSYIKFYAVFNVDQVEGLPEKFYAVPKVSDLSPEKRIASLEAFAMATRAVIKESIDRACYIPSLDIINMPPFESFHAPEGYYGTLCHELVHWTGHHSRLNRELASKSQIEKYAFEELVAEIGHAFLASILGITPEVSDQHVAYLESWLSMLGDNHQLIFKAASQAQKAVEFLIRPD